MKASWVPLGAACTCPGRGTAFGCCQLFKRLPRRRPPGRTEHTVPVRLPGRTVWGEAECYPRNVGRCRGFSVVFTRSEKNQPFRWLREFPHAPRGDGGHTAGTLPPEGGAPGRSRDPQEDSHRPPGGQSWGAGPPGGQSSDTGAPGGQWSDMGLPQEDSHGTQDPQGDSGLTWNPPGGQSWDVGPPGRQSSEASVSEQSQHAGQKQNPESEPVTPGVLSAPPSPGAVHTSAGQDPSHWCANNSTCAEEMGRPVLETLEEEGRVILSYLFVGSES